MSALTQYKWKPWGQLPHAGYGYYNNRVATVQNKIIVADCKNNKFYMSDFHSSAGSWSTVVNTNNTSGGQVHTLFNVGDECFGTFYSEGKQSIAKYTVKKNEWKHVTDIPSHDHLCCYGITADRDHVYIVGGFYDGWNERDTILVYDINTGTQCGSERMSSKRSLCSCTILDNVLYVGGGWDGSHPLKNVECISLHDYCSYHKVADTPIYRCSLTSLCGQLVISGGGVHEQMFSSSSNMVSVLSPSHNMWLPLPEMNEQRSGHGTCKVGDDNLMVVGGRDGYKLLNSVEMLKL